MAGNLGSEAVRPIELSGAPAPDPAPRGSTVRALAAVVTLLLLLDVVALVVNRSGPPAKPINVAQAASTTLAAHSARFHVTTSQRLSGNGMHASSKSTADGIADFAGHVARSTTDLKGVGTITTMTIGGVVYIQLPEAARAQVGQATPWMALDLGLDPNGATSGAIAGSGDVASTLRDLQAASAGTVTGFRTVGQEQVGGVRTTRVAATLDKAAILRQATSIPGLSAMVGDAKIRAATEDLWISDDGLIRQTSTDVEMTVRGATVTSNSTVAYSDFGVSTAAIAAPPASEVTIFSSLMELLQGLQGPAMAPLGG